MSVQESVFARVANFSACDFDPFDRHFGAGDGAGLTDDDFLGLAHNLWGTKVTHKHIVSLVHLHDDKSHGQLESESKTLGEGDNSKHDSLVESSWQAADESLPLVFSVGDVDEQEDEELHEDDSGSDEGKKHQSARNGV